ncbi:MAG: hypothetical protein AVDCRST_MAG59-5302 [uncultured Thermomicrobiales bacterium]|uniref:Uncharacterized protein n=1 Tax=uncultured Thermomicrobiales bacterium TaxID=1645740 RepID=A0A6J4VQ89_9BACT|nr:MAG: hypothetical protein AVDCRST_MAG59-5302 [uncultured Thermomicrobiales bacterium]
MRERLDPPTAKAGTRSRRGAGDKRIGPTIEAWERKGSEPEGNESSSGFLGSGKRASPTFRRTPKKRISVLFGWRSVEGELTAGGRPSGRTRHVAPVNQPPSPLDAIQ